MIAVYLKLAWRNLFRNKRRSFIAGTAIGIGLASLIFTDALIIGMKENMIHSATSSFLGEGQIHRQGFRKTQEIEATVNNLDWVTDSLEKEPAVDKFTPRVMAFGMVTSAANLSPVNVVGVKPSTEHFLSQIDDALQQGTFFEEQSPREILIGSKLAEILEVKLNDRLVVTVSQAESGDLSQELFRVSGIFHFNVREMDRGMVFIRLEKAQEMLGIPDKIHQIALKFKDISIGQDENHPIWEKYSDFGNEAVGWTEILPQIKFALEMSDFSVYIMAVILLGVVALCIINTLFMSLYERIFEFGVLRAVGTRKIGVGKLILFEAWTLSVLSIFLGSIIGFIITLITASAGIDYTGIEFAGMTFRELIYPVLTLNQFIKYPLWVMVFTVVIGIYPALYAAKIAPAEAMRKSL